MKRSNWPAAPPGQRGEAGEHLDVAAGHEPGAGTGEDDHPDGAIDDDAVERRLQARMSESSSGVQHCGRLKVM